MLKVIVQINMNFCKRNMDIVSVEYILHLQVWCQKEPLCDKLVQATSKLIKYAHSAQKSQVEEKRAEIHCVKLRLLQ